MAGYTRATGRDFWYQFDNDSLWRRTPQFNDAIARAYGSFGGNLDAFVDLFRTSFGGSDHPETLRASLAEVADGVRDLAAAQQQVFNQHLPDPDDVIQAFADFGQGVLYDDRPPRPQSRWIHTMDGTLPQRVGYHRFHAFARAAQVCGADTVFWNHVVRGIALAWAVQTEVNPPVRPDNPGLPADRLSLLARVWLDLTDEAIDRAFVINRTGAPPTESFGPAANVRANAALFAEKPAPPSYAAVSAILEHAAGTGTPDHDGNGRFWTLPLETFIGLNIYGVQVIAPPGPNRGANSGLIKALRGLPPFDQSEFPRMPLNRPPVGDGDIAFIEAWIDAGCPQ